MCLTRYEVIAILLALLLGGAMICSAEPGPGKEHRHPHLTIHADIDAENSRVEGSVLITAMTSEGLTVLREGVKILALTIGGRAVTVDARQEPLALTAPAGEPVEIRFEGMFRPSQPAGDAGTVRTAVDAGGVLLVGPWFPRPEGLFTYDLKVTLPKGYTAVSEADEITVTERESSAEFLFRFPHPSEGPIITASKQYVVSHGRHGDTDLVAYTVSEKGERAGDCLKAVGKRLETYERLIGPFPFRRLAVVENVLPFGLSAPTVILLERDSPCPSSGAGTALDRGLARQWLGNMVYVDDRQGDWAEGLVAYLADYGAADENAAGWARRKQTLIDFESYAGGARDVPLKALTKAAGSAPKAIGSGKGSMVFHMLRLLAGDGDFQAALTDLARGHRFRRAAWDDLRTCFERVTRKNLSWFFDQWVDGAGAPDISLENVTMKWNGRAFETRFDLVQHGKAFRVAVPVEVFSSAGAVRRTLDLEGSKKSFEILTEDLPERMVVDGGYDLMRRLSGDEFPPVISRLIGADTLLIVPPQSGAARYNALQDLFGNPATRQADAVTIKDMESSSYLILGDDNPVLRRLFGRVSPQPGFTLSVRKNPFYPEKVVGIASAPSEDEVKAAAGEIPRYGTFSRVSFENGRKTSGETAPSSRGIEKDLAGQTPAVEPPPPTTLSRVIDGVRDKRIVYVGEAHDRFAHHAAQLEIIKALRRSNRKVAIGMEMFQRPTQQALDDFLASRIDEREFITRSEYFKRWGYDYHLYKPILDYARQQNIPVVALNIRREVTEKVAKGGIDGLTDGEKKDLPGEIDFSDQAYRDRLYEIYKSHPTSREGSFDFFAQNQLLWDETMAESVDEFLRCRPDYQMVVLAGNGHIAHGSGIPKRVFRRNGLSFATIVADGEAEKGVADYLISPRPVDAISAPKLMVVLDEKDGRLTVTGFPEHSVSEKAGVKKGDVLLSLDGKALSSVQELRYELYFRKKGDSAVVKVKRQEPGEPDTVREITVTF